jgi:tRNA-splicing ligase RtcB
MGGVRGVEERLQRQGDVEVININTDKPYSVFADVIEQGAIDQFESAMNQPFTVRGALMPDAHHGYSLPIGAVVATDGVVLPSWVGYDIGCGMCALQLDEDPGDIRSRALDIFNGIYEAIPVGFSHNTKPTPWAAERDMLRSNVLGAIFDRNGLNQLGTLGGGNHFIEIGEDENHGAWVVIHSGSRGIGHAVATHYMKLASGDGKAREGHFGFEADTRAGAEYITDLAFCLEFALANRKEMLRRIVGVVSGVLGTTGSDWESPINRNHNHAELRDGLWIHRKGATHAESGMMGVIPGNMRDGSFIVMGKGNPDALWSSSHGAGRVLGRKEAKRQLTLDQFTEAMHGVVALITQETLDESPFAYKNIFDVMAMQSELVDVVAHVKPIINVKG